MDSNILALEIKSIGKRENVVVSAFGCAPYVFKKQGETSYDVGVFDNCGNNFVSVACHGDFGAVDDNLCGRLEILVHNYATRRVGLFIESDFLCQVGVTF